MKNKVLLTRPRAASERTAETLTRLGFVCAIDPLFRIEPTGAPRPHGDFDAIWITSANAVEAMEIARVAVADLLPLPCFCVGEATGATARAFKFTNVQCGKGDSSDLARLMVHQMIPEGKRLLHIGGEYVRAEAETILEQHECALIRWPVYRAIPAEDLSVQTKKGLAQGDIGAIPVFSPRSAETLVSLIEKNNLTFACPAIMAIGLSQAVADVLKKLPWQSLRIAAKPIEEEIFACL